LLFTLIAGAVVLITALPAGAVAGDVASSPASVDVVKVQGTIDPAMAAYVRGTIQESERLGATVILQIDSPGGFGDEALGLGRFIRSASVPVVAWVGPSGARASGGALFLLYGSSLAAMAPGAGVGPARPFDLATRASRESAAEVVMQTDTLLALAPGSEATPEGVRQLVNGPAVAAGKARAIGAAALVARDVPDLLRALDGRTVQTTNGPRALITLNEPARPVVVRFHEIGPIRRVLHAVSTPAAVYVLLVLGLWGLAFELTQPGFGIAGIAGAVFLVFAGYGLTVIPVNWLGLALVLAGIGLQGLDVVLKRVQVLTIAGTGVFAAGSVLAWRGVAPQAELPIWLIVIATVGGLLFFGFGMTVALKAKQRIRSTQAGLVGLVGETRSDLNPEGGVLVKGALWRARSMDGPIPKGTRVRVRGIDGLILRVEQEPD
jgi:membrane-bound serine protease (ClpP class)